MTTSFLTNFASVRLIWHVPDRQYRHRPRRGRGDRPSDRDPSGRPAPDRDHRPAPDDGLDDRLHPVRVMAAVRAGDRLDAPERARSGAPGSSCGETRMSVPDNSMYRSPSTTNRRRAAAGAAIVAEGAGEADEESSIAADEDATAPRRPSRRTALKGAGALPARRRGLAARWTAFAQSGSDAPIRLGFQVHRTGIGAAYGRWYERTTKAAVKLINDAGGIGGRPVEMVIEDDGTDPKRGAEVVEKFAVAAQGRLGLRHALLARGDRLGAARRRAEDAVLRGQRRLPRRLRHAEPLRLPARHHRRAAQVTLDGAVGRRQPRQEGHDDLPRLRLRLRPPRLLLRGDGGAGRRDRADPDPADRDLLHHATSRRSRPTPRCSTT